MIGNSKITIVKLRDEDVGAVAQRGEAKTRRNFKKESMMTAM
jgi:hypothetical protein